MPSRLVLSWPGCATSASTERSTMPPIAMRSSVHRRRARAAVGGIDVGRVGEHFERQAGGLGVLAGQHHRARAGIEHHGDGAPLILRGHVEIAAECARPRPCVRGDDVAGNKLAPCTRSATSRNSKRYE